MSSNSSKTKLKELAQRLLAYEAASGKPAIANESPAFRVCEKLRRLLGKLMGAGGYQALFSRAQAMASEEVPWLRELRIQADGSLEGFDVLEAKRDKKAIGRGEVALVAQLLGLLVIFIGPDLTLRLLQEAWPKVAPDELNFAEGEKL